MAEFDQGKEFRTQGELVCFEVQSDGSYSLTVGMEPGPLTEEQALELRDYITHTSGNPRNRTTTIPENGPQKIGEALVFAIDGKSTLEIHPDHYLIDGVKVDPREEGEAQRCIDIVVEALK